jgi:hypothetical protein
VIKEARSWNNTRRDHKQRNAGILYKLKKGKRSECLMKESPMLNTFRLDLSLDFCPAKLLEDKFVLF